MKYLVRLKDPSAGRNYKTFSDRDAAASYASGTCGECDYDGAFLALVETPSANPGEYGDVAYVGVYCGTHLVTIAQNIAQSFAECEAPFVPATTAGIPEFIGSDVLVGDESGGTYHVYSPGDRVQYRGRVYRYSDRLAASTCIGTPLSHLDLCWIEVTD